MENETISENQENSGISLNEEIKEYLMETAKWAKFLSILGFIGIGLMFLGVLFSMIINSTYNSYGDPTTGRCV